MQTEYDIVTALKRIENELQDSMMRNFEKHKLDEIREGFEWEMWQSVLLRELQEYRKKNLKKYVPEIDGITAGIVELFLYEAEAAEEQLAEHLGQYATGEPRFFKFNEKKLGSLIEATKSDFSKAKYSVLRQADDEFRKIIFNAQTYAATGATYEQAVDMASKDFLRAGINCIQYKNGSRHKISEYASMAIRTGQKRAYLMGEGNTREHYGIHTVRVNQRQEGCPHCVPWQGRVLIDDVYCSGTKEEAEALGVPTLSEAIRAGFLHPNCKDTLSTYIPGVSKPSIPWTQEEIDELVLKYNDEQEMKHAEVMKESYERMAENALDEDNKKIYEARANNWQNRIEALEEKK